MSTDKITPQREAALIAADELQKAYEAGKFHKDKNSIQNLFVGDYKLIILWFCELHVAYCRVLNAEGKQLNLTEWRL